MTPGEKKGLAVGGLVAAGIALWYYWPRKSGPGRRVSELTIDSNVYSDTFGLPLYGPPVPANPAENAEMRRLIDVSNALIAADDA